MGKKLYVGNLAYSMTDGELQSLFEEYGTVESAQIIMDRETGRSKGFGFVEMADAEAADGDELLGRRQDLGRELRPRADADHVGRTDRGRRPIRPRLRP